MPRRRSDPETKPKPLVIQITHPVPGLVPRWVGAVVFVDRRAACNNVYEQEMRMILENPTCWRIVGEDEITSAFELYQDASAPHPPEQQRQSSSLRRHLRVD